MAQYVMSMLRVSKIVPPKRQIIKDISLSFFPGAKIGLLGLNGSGKSTVLRIMAKADTEFDGEVQHLPNLRIGYLPQEPQLDPAKTVREEVESGMGEVMEAQAKLEAVYAAYAEENADFDKLAEEQARLEAIIATSGADSETQLEIAADALRLPAWDARSRPSPAARSAAWRCASCCSPSPTCCCWTSRPTTSMPNPSNGWSSTCCASPAPWWP
jgi:sulfate-transporting ATPase